MEENPWLSPREPDNKIRSYLPWIRGHRGEENTVRPKKLMKSTGSSETGIYLSGEY